MTPIFYIKEGSLRFADKILLSDLEVYIYKKDKICLIGKNGCGKSSLMKVIASDYELDKGELFKNPSIKIGYLTQELPTNLNVTIYDFILNQFPDREHNKYKADILLENLQLDGNVSLLNCSGGQLRRANLAKILALEPDILLLDEPTNHLDIATILWLENFVKSYSGAIICISHDRAFLSNVTNKIWWLDNAVLRKSEQGFKYFDEWRELVTQQEELTLRKLHRKLDNEKDWLNAGVTARRKRNQKRLSNLQALREQFRQQKNKLLVSKQKIDNIDNIEVKKTQFIIEANSISLTFEHKKIIDNFSFRVIKGEKIGLIGSNGAGKSTLIKLLTKQLEPQSGIVTHGKDLKISYFDQLRTDLDPTKTLQQIICPTGGDQVFLQNQTMHCAAYLKKFMFDPKILNNRVSTLSGGEASRLLLAKTLMNPGNLLILDEPTNDLDMDSLEILLDILTEYKGTLIIVSHDRDFLDKLVTRSLVFNSNKIIDLIGGYEDYQKLILPKSPPKHIDKLENSTSKNSTSKPKNTPATTKKLSYKHQRLLETIPIEIDKLEVMISSLELLLSDSNLYLSNPKKFTDYSNELKDCQDKLDELLNQWLEISDTNCTIMPNELYSR
jgi:ATP-binding cassette subfamily F protein uup